MDLTTDAGIVKQQTDDGKNRTADNCTGQAVLFQERELVPQPVTEPDGKDPQRQCVEHGQFDDHSFHLKPPLVV